MKHSKMTLASLAIPVVLAGTTGIESKVHAEEAVVQPSTTQYLTALVKAPGIGGALWGDTVTLSNPSESPSEVRVVVTPYGASAGPEDYAKTYVVPAKSSVEIKDILDEPSLQGAMSATFQNISGEPVMIAERVENTQHLGNDSSKKSVFFMFTNSYAEKEMMLPGDRSIISMPEDPYYTNIRLAGKMETGDVEFPLTRITGYIRGVKVCSFDKEIKSGGVIQIAKLGREGTCPAANYSYFEFEQLRGKGLVEASHIYANPDLAGANDAGIERAIKKALLEEFTVGISPNKAEVGDTLALAGYARGRPGTTVTGMAMGWRPKNAVYQTDGNTTREVLFNKNGIANVVVTPASGDTSNTPYAKTTVIDEDGNAWGREITGKAVPVDPAKDYTFDAAVANPIIRARKNDIANILAKGVYSLDRKQYPASEWAKTLDMYQDGIVTPSNMEAKAYRILGGALGFDVQGTDNRSDGVLFMSKQHLDQLRDILQGR